MPSYSMFFGILAALVLDADGLSVLNTEAAVEVAADAKQLIRHKAGEPDKDEKKGPVSISLYYETRCPDCIRFINKTLSALWEKEDMRDHINITMNPYGNSMSIPVEKVSEGYKFFHAETTGDGWKYVHICQHGSDECFGNLLQACAIEKVEKEKYMDLVICMASEPDWGIEKLGYECMTKAKIDPKPIKDCMTSPHGNTLMAQFGESTGKVQGRTGTPWVMINGVNLQTEDPKELLRTTCHGLSGLESGPKSCEEFKNDKTSPAPGPAAAKADDTFTVLPVIKEAKNLIQLPTAV